MDVVLKVIVLSGAIALAIKGIGPYLPISDHQSVVLAMVFLPSVLTAGYLFRTGLKQDIR